MANGAPGSQFHNAGLVTAVSTPSALSVVCPVHGAVKTAQGDHPQFNNNLVFFLQLAHHQVIERTEFSTNHVLVYLEKVSLRLGLEWERKTQALGTFGHPRQKTRVSKLDLIKVGMN